MQVILSAFLFSLLCHCSCSQFTHYDYLLQAAPISFLQHPDSVQTTSGSDVNFTCISNVSVDPLWPYQPEYFPKLFWRFNGTSLNVSDMGEVVRYPAHWVINSTENISHLRVSNVSDSDMGYYECVVGDGLHTRGNGFAYVTVSKRAWLNVVGQATEMLPSDLTAPTIVGKSNDLWGADGIGNKKVELMCTTSDPYHTLYWYKDGVDVTAQYYDSEDGSLYNEEQGNLYGVYQCFVENSAGSDNINIRVLPDLFANPPTNFSCRAVDQDNGMSTIIMSWEPPTLLVNYDESGIYQPNYEVRINGKTLRSGIKELSTTISNYSSTGGVCEVFVLGRRNNGSVATAALDISYVPTASTVVSTTTEYVTATPTKGSSATPTESMVTVPTVINYTTSTGYVPTTSAIVSTTTGDITATPTKGSSVAPTEGSSAMPNKGSSVTPNKDSSATPTESMVTVPTVINYTTESTSTSNSTASSSQLTYLWIAIAVIVFVIIMVVVLMLVIWSAFGHSHHQQVRDREKLHHLARVVEQQIDDKEYPPLDPFSLATVLHGSSYSINTELDYFCPVDDSALPKNTSFELSLSMIDKDPKLDMDMSLSRSRLMDDNTRQSSDIHDNNISTDISAPDSHRVSDTDILNFLRENAESGHNTGSSGYGTDSYFSPATNELGTSRMEERFNEVSDSPQVIEEQTYDMQFTNLSSSSSSLHTDSGEVLNSSSVIRLVGKDTAETPGRDIPHIVIACSEERDYVQMEDLPYLNVHCTPDPHVTSQ